MVPPDDPAGPTGGDSRPPSPDLSVWSDVVTGEPGATIPRGYRAPRLWECLLGCVGCVLILVPLCLTFMWVGTKAVDPSNPLPAEEQERQMIARREAEFRSKSGMRVCAFWGATVGVFVGSVVGALFLHDAVRGAMMGVGVGCFVGAGLAHVPYHTPTLTTMLFSLPVALISGVVYWSKFGAEG